MADEEFNFDEFFDNREVDSVANSNTGNTQATRNTSNITTGDNDSTPHPFSARLSRKYVEIIKALAWWERVSQREVIEQALEKVLEELGEEKLADIVSKYKNNLK